MTGEMIKDGHLGGYIRGGDPATWSPHLWSWLLERYAIRSLLDVGCGEAHSTRFFAEHGCRVIGVDGCEQAIRDSRIPEAVVQHDFCEGPFLPSEPCEMIWSCEFLEHVEPSFVPHILRTFETARKMVVVTHAFPGQEDGYHHVHCRPSRYWIETVESIGFVCAVDASRRARILSLEDHLWVNHFARSGLIFLRPDEMKAWSADVSRAAWSASRKSRWITGRVRRSRAYWTHRRRRHAWKRRQRKEAAADRAKSA